MGITSATQQTYVPSLTPASNTSSNKRIPKKKGGVNSLIQFDFERLFRSGSLRQNSFIQSCTHYTGHEVELYQRIVLLRVFYRSLEEWVVPRKLQEKSVTLNLRSRPRELLRLRLKLGKKTWIVKLLCEY